MLMHSGFFYHITNLPLPYHPNHILMYQPVGGQGLFTNYILFLAAEIHYSLYFSWVSFRMGPFVFWEPYTAHPVFLLDLKTTCFYAVSALLPVVTLHHH